MNHPTGVPVTVTAYLQQGAGLDTLFGTALDGLLASQVRERAKAAATLATGEPTPGSVLDGGLHENQPATVELPLARCTLAGNRDWHWLATTAFPLNIDGTPACGDYDVHHQHCRVRERLVDQIVARVPASIPPDSGRYRMRRLPVVTTPAHRLVWHAIGDPDAITDLLANIVSIGRRRNTGEGTVLRWEVTPTDTRADTRADTQVGTQVGTRVGGQPWTRTAMLRHGHLHPDQTLGRPTPAACVQALDISTDRTGTAGLRPPYWHRATQRRLYLPEPLGGEPHAAP